jgi:hypothetical protein
MLFFSRDLTRLSSEAVLSKGRPHASFLFLCGLADLLTGHPRDSLEEQRRDNTLTDLGTCVGLTHYYLEDLRTQEHFRESQRHTKN